MTTPVLIVHNRPGRTEVQLVDIPPTQMDKEEFREQLRRLVTGGVLKYDPVDQVVWLPPISVR